MQPGRRTQVRFFEAKRDGMKRPIAGAPNARAVEQLGLKNKGAARIGFKVEGTVIYAKERKGPKAPGALLHAWHNVIGRSKTRKLAAAVVVTSLERKVNKLPAPAVTTEVIVRMNDVRTQLTRWGTVAAGDLQSLHDSISRAANAHAANQEQLKFNANVKDTAVQMCTPKTRHFVLELGQPANLQFHKGTITNFLNFIKNTAALDLDAVGPQPLDYKQAHAFARAWTDASPKSLLGKPEDRYLIDRLAKLVLEACKSPDDAEPQSAPQFRCRDERTLERISDGALFVRDDSVRFGQGGNGSVSAYKCGTESLVVKKLIQDETDPSRNLEALAEARVHSQASQGGADHVVGIHGTVVTDDGGVLIILQHAPRGESATVRVNIDKAVKDGDLSPEAASRAKMLMFVDMLKGADQTHANGVTHSDLKFENYFVDAAGRMLLGDFGTSRGVLGDFGKPGIASIDYTAPEINLPNKECPITYMSDIWSLGVMLYELVSPRKENEKFAATALRPFPYEKAYEGRDSIDEFVKKDLAWRFKQLLLNPLGPNHQLHRLIMKMLDPDPLKRPSLKTVLEHPLFARYANPMNDEEEAIVAGARQTILAYARPVER